MQGRKRERASPRKGGKGGISPGSMTKKVERHKRPISSTRHGEKDETADDRRQRVKKERVEAKCTRSREKNLSVRKEGRRASRMPWGGDGWRLDGHCDPFHRLKREGRKLCGDQIGKKPRAPKKKKKKDIRGEECDYYKFMLKGRGRENICREDSLDYWEAPGSGKTSLIAEKRLRALRKQKGRKKKRSSWIWHNAYRKTAGKSCFGLGFRGSSGQA